MRKDKNNRNKCFLDSEDGEYFCNKIQNDSHFPETWLFDLVELMNRFNLNVNLLGVFDLI